MPVVPRAGTPYSWSKDAQAHPWLVTCHRTELGCHFYLATKTEEEGQVRLALHTCPHRGPTKIGLMVKVTLLEESWELLDELVDKIMDPDTPEDEKTAAKEQARGISKVLAIFMHPFFELPSEISGEARLRWQARQSGDTTYQTKGLGSRATEFPEGFRSENVLPATKPTRTTRQSRKPAEKQLTPADIEGIKAGKAAGFTDEQLAGVYGVSSGTIAKVV